MWKHLDGNYISTSKTRVMEINLQLQTTKKDNMSVLDHFDKMKALVDELATIGRLLDEQDLVILIFESFTLGFIH